MLCDYGCGKEAKHKFKNGKWCCSLNQASCEMNKVVPWNKGKVNIYTKEQLQILRSKRIGTIMSEETKNKIRNKLVGRKREPFSEEHKKNISKNKIGKKIKPYPEEGKEKHRYRMLNGGAIIALRGNKNPSKPEVMLRNIVKELYPNCEFQYKVLNYALDIAIPEYKIAIEYDGWYHFNCLEKIDYYKNRQKMIEGYGWKFVQYSIYDKFPTKDKIEQDISKIRKEI